MAAACKALQVLESEPERVARLRENVDLFVGELNRRGVPARSESAIVPILIGDERKALAASAALEREGILVPAVRYPTVARGTARLRGALMSAHEPDQLRRAAAAIADVVRRSRESTDSIDSIEGKI